MAKIIIVLCCAVIACATANPGLVAHLPYTAPVAAAPLAYTASLAYSAPLSYAAAPLAYANAPLDAAYASSRIDIKQNYNAAVPAVALAAAPLAAAVSAPILL